MKMYMYTMEIDMFVEVSYMNITFSYILPFWGSAARQAYKRGSSENKKIYSGNWYVMHKTTRISPANTFVNISSNLTFLYSKTVLIEFLSLYIYIYI